MVVTKRHYRVLPLFASPLEEPSEHHNHGHESDSGASSTLGTEKASTEADQPKFRESEEASSIELFYDLFFVANLTSFTGVHSIDEPAGMMIASRPIAFESTDFDSQDSS